MTATLCPGRRRPAFTTAPTPVMTPQARRQASSAGRSSGSRTHWLASTTTASAKAAVFIPCASTSPAAPRSGLSAASQACAQEVGSPPAQAGLTYYTNLALKDGSSGVGASTWKETDLLDSFVKNKAVMVIQGNWTPKTAISQNPSLKGKIGAFPIPGKDGGIAPAFLGGSNLAVLKTSKNQDLAWKFIKMMTTGDLSKKWADQAGYFPSTTTQLNSYANSTDPLVAPFATTMLKAGKNVPSAPQWGAVEGNQTVTAMLQSILTGTSVQKATKTASDAITKTLQGN